RSALRQLHLLLERSIGWMLCLDIVKSSRLESNTRIHPFGNIIALADKQHVRGPVKRSEQQTLRHHCYNHHLKKNDCKQLVIELDGLLFGNQPRGGRGSPPSNAVVSPVAIVSAKEERSNQPVVGNLAALPSPATSAILPDSQPLSSVSDIPLPGETSSYTLYLQPLPSEATAQQTAQWLQSNRFGSYLRVFSSFSGADILRLSRDDLIQICGLPDGIRLFNALHSKAIAPRLTLYLCMEQNPVYHALYLDSMLCSEMANKLAQLMGITADQIHNIYIQGPGGIHVLITDDVVRNLKDESMFAIEILQDHSGERYRLLLKPAPR
ncbi:hypothetical protein L9F63_015938, partial [Diploptera punctata]